MKRRDLVRPIEHISCHLDREGANHSIYRNPANGRCVAVPRHREIKETTARTICAQLGIPKPLLKLLALPSCENRPPGDAIPIQAKLLAAKSIISNTVAL